MPLIASLAGGVHRESEYYTCLNCIINGLHPEEVFTTPLKVTAKKLIDMGICFHSGFATSSLLSTSKADPVLQRQPAIIRTHLAHSSLPRAMATAFFTRSTFPCTK